MRLVETLHRSHGPPVPVDLGCNARFVCRSGGGWVRYKQVVQKALRRLSHVQYSGGKQTQQPPADLGRVHRHNASNQHNAPQQAFNLHSDFVGIVQSLIVTCRLHGIDPYD